MPGSPGVYSQVTWHPNLLHCRCGVSTETFHQHNVRTTTTTTTTTSTTTTATTATTTTTTTTTTTHRRFTQGNFRVALLFWNPSCRAMSDSAGAAKRRRDRRLRAWHRHVRMTVAMELATALHHSAQGVEVAQRGRGPREARRPTGTEATSPRGCGRVSRWSPSCRFGAATVGHVAAGDGPSDPCHADTCGCGW